MQLPRVLRRTSVGRVPSGRLNVLLLLVLSSLGACTADALFSSGSDTPPDTEDPPTGAEGVATLAFTVQPTSSVAGQPITPDVQVTARDADGNVRTDFTDAVSLALESAAGSLSGETVRNADAGVATFPGLAVSGPAQRYRLRAAALGFADAMSAEFAVALPTVTVVGGDGQADTVAATLPEPCVIRVTDDAGNRVSGIEVTWTVTAGSVVTADSETDANGEARATHKLGTTAGEQRITAEVPQALGSPVSCTATATAGTATRLVFTVEPSDVASNEVIEPPVVVTVFDQFDNPVVGLGVSVEMSIAPLTGTPLATLSGTRVRSATSGAATFDDLRIDLPGLGYRLRAEAGTLTVDSPTFNVL